MRWVALFLVACAREIAPVAVPIAGTIDPHAPLTMPAQPQDDWDADRDAIADSMDLCPADAEDMDGFEDEDGCPDLDNDKDGISDAKDKCPNEPETYNGYEDEDGCPDRSHVIIH